MAPSPLLLRRTRKKVPREKRTEHLWTHLFHLSETALGSATSSWISPANSWAPPGTRSDRSHSSVAPAWPHRPYGNTTVPESGTGCGIGRARETETGNTSWRRRSASPGIGGGCGIASGCASRTANSAGTSSGGASGTETWTCSRAGAGSHCGTTTGWRRWNGTASSWESGSRPPTTAGWTGPRPTGTPRAASPATQRSRSWTSGPAAGSSPCLSGSFSKTRFRHWTGGGGEGSELPEARPAGSGGGELEDGTPTRHLRAPPPPDTGAAAEPAAPLSAPRRAPRFLCHARWGSRESAPPPENLQATGTSLRTERKANGRPPCTAKSGEGISATAPETKVATSTNNNQARTEQGVRWRVENTRSWRTEHAQRRRCVGVASLSPNRRPSFPLSPPPTLPRFARRARDAHARPSREGGGARLGTRCSGLVLFSWVILRMGRPRPQRDAGLPDSVPGRCCLSRCLRLWAARTGPCFPRPDWPTSRWPVSGLGWERTTTS